MGHGDVDHAGDFFLVLPSPKKGAGWGGGAQRARGNKIDTAVTQNVLLTFEIAVI